MDFKQLMNLASQNKARAQKQETRDVTSRNNKSDQSRVSDEAVKAFLAKKELEKKRKAAEEEAAKRTRIEERLTQSLGIKKKESAKGTACDKTVSDEQKGESCKSDEKQADKRNLKQNEHRSMKEPEKLTSKKLQTDKTRQSLKPVNKNSAVGSKSSTGKGLQGSGNVKKGPAMDFKALLAMAERNKNGGTKSSSTVEHGSNVKHKGSKDQEEHLRNKEEQVKKKEEHVKKSDERSSKQRKVLKTEQASCKPVSKGKTNGQMHSKGSSKLKDEGIPGKTQPSRRDQDCKQDFKCLGLVNQRRQIGLESKTLSSMAASTSHGKSVNSKTVHPNNDRRLMREGLVSKRRDHENLKRKRNPFEDEMDDFIDDGDGDDVDVSKYIKEIFGYDRTRFCDDDDDDLAAMESSYSQIEREEVKSAKIARLEDEIEQLKELHELKQQRDKLKKKSKK